MTVIFTNALEIENKQKVLFPDGWRNAGLFFFNTDQLILRYPHANLCTGWGGIGLPRV